MNITVIILGLIEILVSFITGLFLFFLCFKLFLGFTKKVGKAGELRKENLAIPILLAGFIIGIMIIVRTSAASSMDNLGILFQQKALSAVLLINIIVRILLSYVLGALFAFGIVWISFFFFSILTTKINELEEVKNNNAAAALLLAALIISGSILIHGPVTKLLNGLVASPSLIQSTVAGSLIDFPVVLEALICLPIALLTLLLVFLIGYKAAAVVTRGIDENKEIKNKNTALGLVSSSYIIGTMLLLNAALDPSYTIIHGLLTSQEPAAADILVSILKIVLFLICAGLVAFVMLHTSLFFFSMLTKKVNETEEIRNNNIAVGIIVAIIIIAFALLLEHSMSVVLSGFSVSPGSQTGLPINL